MTLIFIGILLIIKYFNNGKYINTYIKGEYEVKKVISMGPIIQFNEQNILVKTKLHINIHDNIFISGKILKPYNTNNFNLITYLKSNNIFNIVIPNNIYINSVSHDIRSSMVDYLDSGPSSYKQIAALIVLGKKTINTKQIYDITLKLSVIHLFVISGFHITLFSIIIKKILRFLKINEIAASWFSIVPIILYLYMLGFPLSATRASILTILMIVNKNLFKNYFTSLQIFSFTLLTMFFMSINTIYSLSFIYTFIATGSVIILNNFKYKSTFMKFFTITICVYLVTTLVSVYINGWWSIFGLFNGILLSPIFIIVYAISIFLFPFKDLMNEIYKGFIFILNSFNELTILVHFKKPPISIIQSIYLLPLTYLIINKIWNLFMVKSPI